MKRDVVPSELLFEVRDVFGASIRTTNAYWLIITEEKHRELKVDGKPSTHDLTVGALGHFASRLS